jgi:adenosylcobinamide amidohydrolase
MMTAADLHQYCLARVSHCDLVACAVTTAGCRNLASVGETGNYLEHGSQSTCTGTINLIVVTNYRFTHEAMLEAIQIATEAKVKAVYEFGLRRKLNGEPATGTGTDCIAVAVGSERRYLFCGKHTKWGELVGRASLERIRGAVRTTLSNQF